MAEKTKRGELAVPDACRRDPGPRHRKAEESPPYLLFLPSAGRGVPLFLSAWLAWPARDRVSRESLFLVWGS